MSEGPRNEQQRVSTPDFLRRMIDGAFERANPLEPRLPSLFEPQTVAIASAVASSAELAGRNQEHAAPAQFEERPEREVHRQTVPTNAPASRERIQADIDPPNEARRRAELETARVVKADHEREVAAGLPARSPARPHEEETDRNVLTPNLLQMTVAARRDGQHETAHELQRPLLELPSGVLLAQKVISTTETIREPTLVHAPESREVSPGSIERPEYLQDRPVPPTPEAQRIVVEPPTVRYRPEREPLHAEVTTPGSEPVINVTIGRIEVRAVLAQPCSTRQPSQGPKPMNLDDYLKQRGGRR